MTLLFTVYEEVGHGASPLYKEEIEDLLAVDMGCVGDDLTCRETQVSICAKDSAGPYDYDFTTELINRAKRLGLDYAVDVYPRYSSDTATALRAGLDARYALCDRACLPPWLRAYPCTPHDEHPGAGDGRGGAGLTANMAAFVKRFFCAGVCQPALLRGKMVMGRNVNRGFTHFQPKSGARRRG